MNPLNKRTIGLAVAFMVALGTWNFGFTETKAQASDTLIQKIDALVTGLDALVKAINPKETADKDAEANLEEENSLQSVGVHMEFPGCLDNYEAWPTSNKPKQGQIWDLSVFNQQPAYHQNVVEQFIDMNGDGLLDYIYMDRGTHPTYLPGKRFRQFSGCLLTNNGSGHDVSFRCVVRRAYDSRTRKYNVNYYGDCADLD